MINTSSHTIGKIMSHLITLTSTMLKHGRLVQNCTIKAEGAKPGEFIFNGNLAEAISFVRQKQLTISNGWQILDELVMERGFAS
jgi:hypothetical protein